MPFGKIFKMLIARGEAVERANLAAQQSLMGLTPETDWRTVTVANPNWRDLFVALCDSPPEVELLIAFIELYGLRPQDGALHSRILKLQLQVPIKPYRIDFLINDNIIVEVDGKTYHSSKEAVKRDLDRDSYFREKGFAVIRIPAQRIFTDARGAVGDIMRSGEMQSKPQIQGKPKNFSLDVVLGNVGKAISDVNSIVEKAQITSQVGQDALAEQQQAFYRERKLIDRAIVVVLRRLDGEKYRAQSIEHAAWYDAAHMQRMPSRPAKAIPAFKAPTASVTPLQDAALQRAFALIEQERAIYFEKVREQMRADARLSKMVEDKLCGEGRTTLWNLIAPALS